ncbi:hypothetical protein C8Q80DRAFT_1124780 [Daedaleopsis nitida]|nr:hypothetical protein C8Q80DRAFT_1124780 [Daedaleopsis nitida]
MWGPPPPLPSLCLSETIARRSNAGVFQINRHRQRSRHLRFSCWYSTTRSSSAEASACRKLTLDERLKTKRAATSANHTADPRLNTIAVLHSTASLYDDALTVETPGVVKADGVEAGAGRRLEGAEVVAGPDGADTAPDGVDAGTVGAGSGTECSSTSVSCISGALSDDDAGAVGTAGTAEVSTAAAVAVREGGVARWESTGEGATSVVCIADEGPEGAEGTPADMGLGEMLVTASMGVVVPERTAGAGNVAGEDTAAAGSTLTGRAGTVGTGPGEPSAGTMSDVVEGVLCVGMLKPKLVDTVEVMVTRLSVCVGSATLLVEVNADGSWLRSTGRAGLSKCE